jgi:hypothetical protein
MQSLPGQDSIYLVARTALNIASIHAINQLRDAQLRFYVAIILVALFSSIGLLTALYVPRTSVTR